MSLISQNVPLAFKANKTKREDADEPSFLQGNEENGDGEESTLNIMRTKKRKKAQKEGDEKEAIEQDREMKKLENFLFGAIYSPLEFGKEDKEEAGYAVDKGSALFFVDCSANSVLSVPEEDAELSRKLSKGNPYGLMRKRKRPT